MFAISQSRYLWIIWLALLVAIVFTGCAKENNNSNALTTVEPVASINLKIDSNFSSSPVSNQILQDTVLFIEEKIGDNILASESTDTRTVTIQYDDSLSGDTLGKTDCELKSSGHCTIRIHNSLRPEQYTNAFQKQDNISRMLLWTVRHEIGHSFGMGHSDKSDDVMYPSYTPNNSTDEAMSQWVEKLNSFRLTGNGPRF